MNLARLARPAELTARKIARTDARHLPASDVTALLRAWNEGNLDARSRSCAGLESIDPNSSTIAGAHRGAPDVGGTAQCGA